MAVNPVPDFQFHHAGVSVPDLEAALEWYARVLGFTEERRFPIPAARATVALIRRGDLRVELFEVDGASPLPPGRREPDMDIRTHGNKHVAFQIDDLDAFLGHVEAQGAEVAMVIRESFGSGCYIRDCAGNLIEFVVAQNAS